MGINDPFKSIRDALLMIHLVNKTGETRWDVLMKMVEDVNAKSARQSRPTPENLEHIGMELLCIHCCNPTSWLPCWNCGGEGGWDDEDLLEEDPLWYGPGDYRRCDECHGKGGHNYCTECRKTVKVKKDE